MKKNTKTINKNVPFVNKPDLCVIDYDINKKYENNKSFNFIPFYNKFSELYPNKEKPDFSFLE
jgi:hypothetical protein